MLKPDDFLEEDAEKRPYKFHNGLLVRLDRLPFIYEHRGAVDGGLGRSDEFLFSWRELKSQLAQDAERYGFSNSEAQKLIKTPSIMTGARLSVFPETPWRQSVWYAMHKLGLWDESFRGLRYSSYDNCIEGYPSGFNYGLLPPVIEALGGWIDFSPGVREQAVRPVMTCNFTTSGKDKNGLKAIVQSIRAESGNPTREQQRFMEAVFEAFRVL